MDMYNEPSRDIPIAGCYDVIVVGGGPAGFGAACAAARAGVRTLLIEQSGGLGGVATMGLMSHWTGNTFGPILDELRERAKDTSQDFNYFGDKVLKSFNIIHPEKTKLAMMEMLQEAGAQWRLFTFASDVIVEDGTVKGIIVESKNGRQALKARVVIDASGDGDIAAAAGVPFHMGRETDGAMQPMTVMFKIGGVDFERAVFPGEFDDEILINGTSIQQLGRDNLASPNGHVLLYPSSMPGVVTVNMTNSLMKNGTSAEDLTQADLECRQQIPKILEFIKSNIPGYEKAFVMQAAAAIGVRETRHFEGAYTLTEDDILQAKVFEDWIATQCWFNFDVHNMSGSGLDESGNQKEFHQTKGYTIPYRSILPQNVEGLLLAGRNLSGTHMAHSNYRVMPICLNVGQGAGAAAALSCQKDCSLRDLNPIAIQALLNEQGVTL